MRRNIARVASELYSGERLRELREALKLHHGVDEDTLRRNFHGLRACEIGIANTVSTLAPAEPDDYVQTVFQAMWARMNLPTNTENPFTPNVSEDRLSMLQARHTTAELAQIDGHRLERPEVLQRREEVTRWICQVSRVLGLDETTCHAAMYTLDRTEAPEVPHGSPWFSAVHVAAALGIAAKCQRGYDGETAVHRLLQRAPVPYEAYVQAEFHLLQVLDWNVECATCLELMDNLIDIISPYLEPHEKVWLRLLSARTLTKTLTQSPGMYYSTRPIEMAAAVLLGGMQLIRCRDLELAMLLLVVVEKVSYQWLEDEELVPLDHELPEPDGPDSGLIVGHDESPQFPADCDIAKCRESAVVEDGQGDEGERTVFEDSTKANVAVDSSDDDTTSRDLSQAALSGSDSDESVMGFELIEACQGSESSTPRCASPQDNEVNDILGTASGDDGFGSDAHDVWYKVDAGSAGTSLAS